VNRARISYCYYNYKVLNSGYYKFCFILSVSTIYLISGPPTKLTGNIETLLVTQFMTALGILQIIKLILQFHPNIFNGNFKYLFLYLTLKRLAEHYQKSRIKLTDSRKPLVSLIHLTPAFISPTQFTKCILSLIIYQNHSNLDMV
jgi:hypothetical protein